MKRKKKSMKEIVELLSPRLSKEQVAEISDRVWQKLEAEMAKHDLSLRSLYGDGWSAPALNPNEHLVLTAVSLLQDHGVSELKILEKSKELSANSASTTAVALALRSLNKRRLVTPQLGLTEDGDRALRRARAEGKTLAGVRDESPIPESSR